MKHLFFTALVLTITNFLGIKALAQKDITPYAVNPLIGDTLTLEERDYYQLFPQIEGFQSAVFYLNPDSTLNADVKYWVESRSRDTLIQSYRSLKSLNYHICARNALENETLDTFHPAYESPEYKKGSEVYAYMNDGRETSGELLSVRKNSLLILNTDCNNDLLNPDCINQTNFTEIDKLVIEGNSNLGLGIGLGLLASIIVGALVIESYNDGSFLWGYDAILPTILSTVGCITLGAVIGIATSTPDQEIKTFSKYDIRGLSSYSRYPEEEPNQLRKIE
ncbi:MAG: hypothetical protein IH620_03475 [Ignavibacterium sp.]|nr:hypothetical protein [Ignavibacterium sp.]